MHHDNGGYPVNSGVKCTHVVTPLAVIFASLSAPGCGWQDPRPEPRYSSETAQDSVDQDSVDSDRHEPDKNNTRFDEVSSNLVDMFIDYCVSTNASADEILSLLVENQSKLMPSKLSDIYFRGIIPFERAVYVLENDDNTMIKLGYAGQVTPEARRLESVGLDVTSSPIFANETLSYPLGNFPANAIGTKHCSFRAKHPAIPESLLSQVKIGELELGPPLFRTVRTSAVGNINRHEEVLSWEVGEGATLNYVHSLGASESENQFIELTYSDFVRITDRPSTYELVWPTVSGR